MKMLRITKGVTSDFFHTLPHTDLIDLFHIGMIKWQNTAGSSRNNLGTRSSVHIKVIEPPKIWGEAHPAAIQMSSSGTP